MNCKPTGLAWLAIHRSRESSKDAIHLCNLSMTLRHNQAKARTRFAIGSLGLIGPPNAPEALPRPWHGRSHGAGAGRVRTRRTDPELKKDCRGYRNHRR